MSFSTPQVSIIIVNYNSMSMLDECIDSIKEFTKDIIYEIIVVDNNSSESIEPIQKKYTDVTFILNKVNHGFAAANNKGLSVATGKHILFLNNDTLFIENTLDILVSYIESLPFEPIIGCKLLNTDRTLQVSTSDFDSVLNSIGENLFLYKIFTKSHIWNKYHLNYEEVKTVAETDVVKGAFLMCRKGLVDKLKGFDELFYFYSEETDFCFRAKNIGAKVIFYPATSIIHHGGATTDKMPWFAFENIHKARMTYFLKNTRGTKRVLLICLHYSGIFIRGILYSTLGMITFRKKQCVRGWYYIRQLFLYPKFK